MDLTFSVEFQYLLGTVSIVETVRVVRCQEIGPKKLKILTVTDKANSQ